MSFRKHAHTDSLNTISILSDTFRSIIQNAESRSLTPVKTVTIEKSELTKWTELAESTRLKLIRSEDNSMSQDDLSEQSEASLFTSKFAKTNSKHVNLLDVCSGDLNHVNLKQVSLLESNLSQLYKKLTRLKESLETNINENKSNNAKSKTELPASNKRKSQLLPLHRENLKSLLDECCLATQTSCSQLFDLSLIVPSAPWSTIKISPIDKLSQEALMSKLKSIGLPKSKLMPVECLLKAYYVASNYHNHMKSSEIVALNEEIKFYRSSYSLQKEYIESVSFKY